MQNIDFNDVLVQQGVAAVRAQLTPLIAPSVPSASDATPSFSEELKQALSRFRLIIDNGKVTNKVFDAEARLEMTKTQFANKTSKKLVQAWFEHEVQHIDRADVNAMRQQIADKSIEHLLERFFYIDGTEEAWDTYKLRRIKLAAVKHKDPNNYDTWYKSMQRKEIEPENIWFDPTGDRRPTDGSLYANSYRGLAITPDEMTHEQAAVIAKPMIDLLSHLCNHDADAIDWAMNWLAIPLQKPGTKMDTSLVFHGKTQGAGKSLFFGGVMGAIYGEYSLTLGQSQLEGQYNDWVDGKLWAIFEEIFAGNDRYQNMGMVKQLITGAEIYINKKFMSGWKQENHVNCVFLSNELMPLAVETDDRRMFVIRPISKCPAALSDEVGRALKDPTKRMLRAFLQFLLTKNIGNQKAHDEAMMTKAKQDLISVASSSWERFVEEWCLGFLFLPFQTVLASELYRIFKRWCENSGEKPNSLNKFTAYLYQTNLVTGYRSHYKDRRDGKRKQAVFIVVGDIPTKDIENHFTKCHNALIDLMSDATHTFSSSAQLSTNKPY